MCQEENKRKEEQKEEKDIFDKKYIKEFIKKNIQIIN
jgi:hypothetical protein